METYHIIKRETGFGGDIILSRNEKGQSSSTVIDTVVGTLEDAGRVLLAHLSGMELDVDGDSYRSRLKNGEQYVAFSIGQDYCECDEYNCQFIIASA